MTDKIKDLNEIKRDKDNQALIDELAKRRNSKREIKDAKTEAHFKAKERI